jgi:hypothetical protein
MRAIGLIFLTLGCAASAVGAAGAGQSVAASQQASSRGASNAAGNPPREAGHAASADGPTHAGKPSTVQQNRRKVSSSKLPTSKPIENKSNGRNELTNGHEPSGSEDSKNSHHPGSDKSRGATQNGTARNENNKHAAPNRTPSAGRPAAPSLSNARHRGANPAIVGGTGNSSTRNTGVLDGTHMNRKRTGN